jgi:hypothetical protein
MPCKNYSRNPGILTDLQKNKFIKIFCGFNAGKITNLLSTLFLKKKKFGEAKLKARSEASR